MTLADSSSSQGSGDNIQPNPAKKADRPITKKGIMVRLCRVFGVIVFNSYKNLNITRIREKYLGELTKYNLDVCEVDPNFNCLGFVSLAQANKSCKKSNQSLSQLLLASKNLNNAYDIFSNNNSSKKYIPSVFSSFRQCVQKTNEQFSKDFIKSNFVKVLLKNQERS